MHHFDYSFLKDEVPGRLVNLSNILYDIRANDSIRLRNNLKTYEKLQSVAIIDSVRSSNAIEGIQTSEKNLNELMKNNSKPSSHGEYEILGYRRAMEEIFSFPSLELSAKYIRHLHSLILGPVSEDGGMYKAENNYIQEIDSDGHYSVRFIPVSANETEEAMEQMIQAYYSAKQTAEISSLLLDACFIVDFLCIHPFRDGNGRVSRLLTNLLLLRNNFTVGRYISIEKKIEQFKYNYYEALRQSSSGWHENRNDYTPFIIFSLQILYQAYKDLDSRFLENQIGKVPKSRRVENSIMNAALPVSKSDLAALHPDVSVTTIERVLDKLMKSGEIEMIGAKRNARYRKK